MSRRFQHDGSTWEVELAGAGTLGCSTRRVEVTFTHAATGLTLPGRVTMAGEGRLSDAQLVSALTDALDGGAADDGAADDGAADKGGER